jgi:thiazole synthase
MVQENLKIADKQFTSRLFLGTGKFGSPQLMQDAVNASSQS